MWIFINILIFGQSTFFTSVSKRNRLYHIFWKIWRVFFSQNNYDSGQRWALFFARSVHGGGAVTTWSTFVAGKQNIHRACGRKKIRPSGTEPGWRNNNNTTITGCHPSTVGRLFSTYHIINQPIGKIQKIFYKNIS